MTENLSNTGQPVFDPRGIVTTQAQDIAQRVGELNGLRLAVLDNTKWNAGKLLRGVVDGLAEDAGFSAVNYYRKESFSKNAAPELIDEIVRDNDVALTAVGD